MVPQLAICHKCGAVLYEGEELKTPDDIILDYDGKCPDCGKKLSYIPKSFEVTPLYYIDQINSYGRESASGMDFCPNCGTRLTSTHKKEGKKVVLQLACPKCHYEESKERTERTPVVVPKVVERVSKDSIVVIGKKERKLRTLPTVRIQCPRCRKNHFYAWMVPIRRLEEPSTQFFRCTRCNYTFRESS